MTTPHDRTGPLYTGLYRHRVDRYRRVLVPATWRQDGPTEFWLLAWPVADPSCIRALTIERFDAVRGELAAAGGILSDKAEAVRRFFAANTWRVALDVAGRLLIPRPLFDAVGLGREVTLVGRLDRFEIWDTGRFEISDREEAGLADKEFRGLSR